MSLLPASCLLVAWHVKALTCPWCAVIHSGPTTVLVLSLLFIAFVVLLHVSHCMPASLLECNQAQMCCVVWTDLGQVPEGLSRTNADSKHCVTIAETDHGAVVSVFEGG